jgi:SAM-dependent methyltransferase
MTDQMLEVARASQPKVARALGYDVLAFRKGYLEDMPVETNTVDVVTSNCVINLSPEKPKVFAELWRVLKDHGRAVIADIVSDRDVPPRLKVNEQLWGECIVGALTEEQFLRMLEQAGFYGLSIVKKAYWKTIPPPTASRTAARSADGGAVAGGDAAGGGTIEGYTFSSVTVQGFKFEKTAGCAFIGQTAIYRGPFHAVLDEEGHLFPRNVAISVCTDTAGKLSHPPYAGIFTVVEPDGTTQEVPAGAPACLSAATPVAGQAGAALVGSNESAAGRCCSSENGTGCC